MNKEMIASIRKEIDKTDDVIIEYLVKRINLILEIIKYKKTEEDVKGQERVQQVLKKVRDKTRAAGGNEEMVVEIYKSMIKILTDMQINILKENLKQDQKQ